MKTILHIFFLIIFSQQIYPQVNQVWVNRYNGDGDSYDSGNSITCDSSGNTYVTGYTKFNGYRICTIKYNSNGNREWIRTYTGDYHFLSLDCEGVSISLDSFNNIIVAGYINTINNGYNFCTIKYDTNGNQLWVKQYNSPENGHDIINDLTIDKNNYIYVTGAKNINILADYCTIKYSPNGDEIWVKTYDGPTHSYDEATSIKVDNDFNIYITGSCKDSSSLISNSYTIKYDSSGNTLWLRRFYSDDTFLTKSLILDKYCNVIVTGTCWTPWNGFCVLKYDSSGNQKFSTFHGEDYYANKSAVDKFGNIYVIGDYWENYNSTFGFCFAKFDSSGNYQWEKKKFDVNGHSNAEAIGIVLDTSANIFITGYFRYDYYTVKYNITGTKLWEKTYNGTGNDVDNANAITLDRSNNVIITGISDGTGQYGNYDIVTIKYSEAIGIQNISTETPTSYTLSQNYPNPFNPTTKINFDIARLGEVKIVVYDIMGREVQTLVNERLKPGTYETSFDARRGGSSSLNSGVYFYKLITEGFTETKRMILLK